MKRLIIVLIFLQSSKISFSQDYIPMAESNKYWFYKHVSNDDTGAFDSGYMLGIERDTSINDTNYKILNYYAIAGSNPCQMPPCWTFDSPITVLGKHSIGYIRDDISSRKVYYLPANNNFTCNDEMQEYLLFDFSVKIGDTLSSCYKIRVPSYDKTGIVDSLAIYNSRFSIFSSGPSGVGGLPYIGEKIISEGLGFSDYGLFHEWYFPLVDFCEGSWEDCNIISSVVATSKNQFVQVYPNPVFNKIEVKSSLQINNYILYDLSGKKLISGKFNNSIDISHFNPGIYFLELILDEGIITKKVVKINQ